MILCIASYHLRKRILTVKKEHRKNETTKYKDITCVFDCTMVVMICGHFQLSPFSILSSSSSSSSRLQLSAPRCSIMDDTHKQGRSKFLEFPYVSAPHKNLMLDLVSKVEDRFQSQLLPCSLPPDVQYYKSNSGTSQVSLHITPGNTESPVIFPLLFAPSNSFVSILVNQIRVYLFG
jgi:hypothetical protein